MHFEFSGSITGVFRSVLDLEAPAVKLEVRPCLNSTGRDTNSDPRVTYFSDSGAEPVATNEFAGAETFWGAMVACLVRFAVLRCARVWFSGLKGSKVGACSERS